MHDPFIQDELKTKQNIPVDSGASFNISTISGGNKPELLKYYDKQILLNRTKLCKHVMQQLKDIPRKCSPKHIKSKTLYLRRNGCLV